MSLISEAVIHGPAVRPKTLIIDRISAVVAWVVLVAAILVLIHVFLRVADTYPYFSVDDSLANISAALSNIGAYGHPALPIQGSPDEKTLRLTSFYIYGPWPFYAGAALDWLFGTSYAIQRFLHPLCLIIATIASVLAFRRLNIGLATIFAWLLFAIFWANMWPMVRPDPFVALFAALAIGSFTWALMSDRKSAWLLGSFFACSAFLTHQIAWAIVPWTLLLLGIGVALRRDRDEEDKHFRRFFIQRLIVMAVGAAFSVMMYLYAIDFRIYDLYRLARHYREGWGARNPEPFYDIAFKHFDLTWAYAAPTIKLVILAGAACGIVGLIASLWLDRRDRRSIIALVAPPILLAVLYALSVGFYPNYHTGYMLVSYVAACWAAVAGFGAAMLIATRMLPVLGPVLRLVTVFVGAYLLIAQSVFILKTGPAWASGQRYIPFTEYYHEVMDNIPQGASVVAGAVFALESGIKYALVEWIAATDAWDKMQPPARSVYVPNYVILNDYLRYLVVKNVAPPDIKKLPPGIVPKPTIPEYFDRYVFFDLYKVVYAQPYGTTRIYKSFLKPGPQQSVPLVSVYDPATAAWASSIEPITIGPMEDVAPVTFDLEVFRAHGQAKLSKKIKLSAGSYLLEIVPAARERGQGVFIATETKKFVSQRGVNLNFELFEAPYWPYEESVFLVLKHQGGDLYLSNVSGKTQSTYDFTIRRAWRVGGLEIPLPAIDIPPAKQWQIVQNGTVSLLENGSVEVTGDDSVFGYELKSPPIKVPPNVRMKLTVQLEEHKGNVAIGVLDGKGESWLSAPAEKGKRTLVFDTQQNRQIFIVIANLNNNTKGKAEKSEFTLSDMNLSLLPRPFDRIRSWFHCYAASDKEQADPKGPCRSESAAKHLLFSPEP